MAKYKKQALAVVGALLASTALAACGGDDPTTPGTNGKAEKGGTLYYKLEDPIEKLDPHRMYTGRDLTNFGRTVYRGLLTFDNTADTEDPNANKPIADIATDLGTASADKKTWSFTVKEGVNWQDGKPVTCEDFKYGASRAFASDVLDGGPTYLASYLDIPTDPKGGSAYKGPYTKKGQDLYDKAVTCDGSTITYKFNKPWADFPLAIASLHMLAPYREDKDQGAKSVLEIFSNGPYMLEGKWNKDSGGTMVRNPEYDVATDETGSRAALPEKIVFQLGDTPEVIYDQLFAGGGDADFTISGVRIPASMFSKIESAKDRYTNPDSPYVDYLVPNMTKLKDVKVRQALALSLNKEAWINAGGGERAYAPAYSIVNPALGDSYAPNPAFENIPDGGDIEGAKALLKEAGVKTPLPIKFTYPQSDTLDKQAAALKESWDEAGFKVTLDGLGDTYYDVIDKANNDSDIMWAGWGADWPSANTVGPPLFNSAQLTPGSNFQNYGRYENKAFDAKADEAAKALEIEEQNKLLIEADAILGEDVAYIPLEIAKFNWLHGAKVTGFATTISSSSYPDLGVIGVSAD